MTGKYSESAFTGKYTPYVLDAKDGNIAILGSNTDAAFYGVTTLMQIFDQMDGNTIQEIHIEDGADTNTRGFIEGYYGVPWSNADRLAVYWEHLVLYERKWSDADRLAVVRWHLVLLK